MDTLAAFKLGEANRDKPPMVFDWIKAARLIRERKPTVARAGLSRDWENTGGAIFENGVAIRDSSTYLCSTWAPPEIDLDGVVERCFVMQCDSPGWDADTSWPSEALAILAGQS